VISLQDAPEPISAWNDVEDQAEVHALCDQYSKEKLEEMLEDLFVKTTERLGKPDSEARRDWAEVNVSAPTKRQQRTSSSCLGSSTRTCPTPTQTPRSGDAENHDGTRARVFT